MSRHPRAVCGALRFAVAPPVQADDAVGLLEMTALQLPGRQRHAAAADEDERRTRSLVGVVQLHAVARRDRRHMSPQIVVRRWTFRLTDRRPYCQLVRPKEYGVMSSREGLVAVTFSSIRKQRAFEQVLEQIVGLI